MEKPVYNLEEAELKNNKAVYQGRKLDELYEFFQVLTRLTV